MVRSTGISVFSCFEGIAVSVSVGDSLGDLTLSTRLRILLRGRRCGAVDVGDLRP